MIPPDKPDADRGARFMRTLLESDPAHLDVASDEEVERQMDAAGIEVSGVPTAEELIARVEKRARESALAAAPPEGPAKAAVAVRRRPGRVSGVPIAAAAALAAVAVVAVMKRAVIVAHLTGEPIGPDPAWTPPSAPSSPPPTPLQRAASTRAAAFAACDAKRWQACAQELDEAAALDPAGERDPRVVSARRAIVEAARVEDEETHGKP